MNLEDRIMEEASKGNYNKVYALALLYVANTRLTKKAASEVEELDGKAVGFSDHACKKCSEYKDKVVFFLLE